MDKMIRTALVTGGARRIGRAIIEDLADAGFAVAIHAHRSGPEAEALAGRIRERGGRAIAVAADLRCSEETAALIENAASALGPVGLLVNCASVFKADEAALFDGAVFDEHMDLHVRAPLILAASLRRQLPQGAGGLIVNIIDQRVLNPNPRFFSYTLSKSALWNATRTLAQAFAPDIRVVAIGPGPTLKSERQQPEDFQAQIDLLPLRAGPALDEFGKTIRFLFDTPSITGQMLALDGGQHLAWTIPGAQEIVE
jgi:NAD(P)-dependent dehydrogenase (short-subunit alcohol dehydrogenase family)